MDRDRFEKRHDALVSAGVGMFKFFWVFWIVSALLGLGLTGAIIYLILKLASHL
jgi:hypothetical protein